MTDPTDKDRERVTHLLRSMWTVPDKPETHHEMIAQLIADVRAETAEPLRAALIEIDKLCDQSRAWNGMGYTYHSMAVFRVQRTHKIVGDALAKYRRRFLTPPESKDDS